MSSTTQREPTWTETLVGGVAIAPIVLGVLWAVRRFVSTSERPWDWTTEAIYALGFSLAVGTSTKVLWIWERRRRRRA